MYTMNTRNSNKRLINDVYFGVKPNKKAKEDDKKKDNDSGSDNDSVSEAGKSSLGLGSKNSSEKIQRDYNHVYFHSEVSRDTIFELCNLIKEAEEENIITSHKLNIDPVPIYLHINSYGGSVYAGFMAVDVIMASKVPIYSIIEGATASAGTLISVVCNKRYIRPNAHMLIHQLSAGCWGKMSEIEDEYKHLEELMAKIKKIYMDNCSIPKKQLNELLKHDIWMDAEKCIKYGLVDEFWTK